MGRQTSPDIGLNGVTSYIYRPTISAPRGPVDIYRPPVHFDVRAHIASMAFHMRGTFYSLSIFFPGSVPDPSASYDTVTRLSVAHAAAAAAAALPRGSPFLFVSAAEAAWTRDPPSPTDFLHRYLVAKRV